MKNLAIRRHALVLGFFVGYLLLAFRALHLQVWEGESLEKEGEARYLRVVTVTPQRGTIFDRRGELLAASSPVESLCASPKDVRATEKGMKALALALGLPLDELKKKLSSGRDFAYIARSLTPAQAQKIRALAVEGFFFRQEFRRYYPQGEAAAPLVGITDIDGRGLEGVELAWNPWLAGKPGKRKLIRDRGGRLVEDLQDIIPTEEGHDLNLSIDARLQWYTTRILANAVAQNRAHHALAMVVDANTGEVLAAASFPAYNPNDRGSLTPAKMRHLAFTDLLEPGSTMKPFTIAAALESGVVHPEEVISTAGGALEVQGKVIHDVHAYPALTITGIIQKSSNVGAAKVGLLIPPGMMWTVFSRAGFGKKTFSGFPGEAEGILRPWKRWRPIEQATMAFGYGLSMPLARLVESYTIFANGGKMVPLTLLAGRPHPTWPVVSPKTAETVEKMLEAVVAPGGTGTSAAVGNFRVAGKTGTARKLSGRHYVDAYRSFFTGMVFGRERTLLGAVMVDEPQGQYFGGAVAGPVFRQMMEKAVDLLQMVPEKEAERLVAQAK